jgi:hypothetical protein
MDTQQTKVKRTTQHADENTKQAQVQFTAERGGLNSIPGQIMWDL